MRLPQRQCPSSLESDSDNERSEYPEQDENGVDELPQHSWPSNKLNFRNIRRGTRIDFQDDDSNWYAAEVNKLDIREKRLYVSFINCGAAYDKWILFDHRVAKINTYTYDNNGNFKIGQIVEVADGAGSWAKATITAVAAELNRVQVTLATDASDDFLGGGRCESKWITGPRHSIRSVQRPPPGSALAVPTARRRWKVPSMTDWQPHEDILTAGEYHLHTGADPLHGPHTERVIDLSLRRRGPAEEALPGDRSESDTHGQHVRKISEYSQCYLHYIHALRAQGLAVVPVCGDGNCLFRAVAHQIYNTEELHALVRARCMDYMEAEFEFFSQFVEGGQPAFGFYLAAKRRSGCWGDDPEIQAMCEIYGVSAEIWAYDAECGARKLRTFHEAASVSSGPFHTDDRGASREGGSESALAAPSAAPVPLTGASNKTIKLSYYGGGHYDSIVDSVRRESSSAEWPAPGTLEVAAIARSTRKQMWRPDKQPSASNSDTTSHDPSVRAALSTTDAEATEQAALDVAIQISRQEHLEWASAAEDMDASIALALELSLRNAQGESGAHTTAESSSALSRDSHASDSAEGSRNADADSTHQEFIKSVAEESEREFIDQAILASLTEAPAAGLIETGEILQEPQLEEEIVKRALLESLADSHPLSMNSSSRPNDDGWGATPNMSNMSDDQLLQWALQQSLQPATSSSSSSAPFTDNPPSTLTVSSNSGSSSGSADYALAPSYTDEEEDLNRAIAESLRYYG